MKDKVVVFCSTSKANELDPLISESNCFQESLIITPPKKPEIEEIVDHELGFISSETLKAQIVDFLTIKQLSFLQIISVFNEIKRISKLK